LRPLDAIAKKNRGKMMPIKSAPFAGLVEFRAGFSPRPRLRLAVFDFDGTLSWLRHGWPELMCEVFLPYYPMRPDESPDEVRRELVAEILSTNGRPSIVQMETFVERVHARHAKVPAPEELLHQYQGRLDKIIAERSEKILRQTARADDFVVFGARTMLELLHQRGVKLFVLSGTLEDRVKQEADLLDLAHYFGGRIIGSPPDSARFSKHAVLDKILAEESLPGESLLCFGDGPVEILHARELGGLAVAVASDENHNGPGRMDPIKRAQLIDAGAHVVIPDYRDAPALLDALMHE
jgi:phosphoglycolate phosphatase-like HAD superfamily hydrolase